MKELGKAKRCLGSEIENHRAERKLQSKRTKYASLVQARFDLASCHPLKTPM